METVWVILSCIVIGFAKADPVDDAGPVEYEAASKEQNNEDRASGFGQAGVRPGSPSQLSLSAKLVECYVCTDCPKVDKNTPTKICPHSLDPNREGRCVVYAEKYQHMQRPWYVRGCASERGTCQEIRKSHEGHNNIVNLLFCHECVEDRCNKNGAASLSDMTIGFIVLVVTPILSKLTLS